MATTWKGSRPQDFTITMSGPHQFQPGMLINIDTGDGKKKQCMITEIVDRHTLQLAELTAQEQSFGSPVVYGMIRPEKERTDIVRREDAPYKDIE